MISIKIKQRAIQMPYIVLYVLPFLATVLALPVNYYQGYPNMYYPPPPPPAPLLPGYYQGPPSLPPPSPSILPPSVTWEQFFHCLNKSCQDDLDECIPECMKPIKNKDKNKDDNDNDNDKDASNTHNEEA